jgi:AhpD family alkylhydroperoxidase
LTGRSFDETGVRRGETQQEVETMSIDIFPQTTPAIAARRKQLAPDIHDAFTAFSERVFAAGALPSKAKQLIAVAVAHVTQCPYCIRGHTKAALRQGATEQEIMEAIWVAAEMRAGGAYAHSAIALDTIDQAAQKQAG